MPILSEDPRIDPRIKAAFGGLQITPTPDVPSREALLALTAQASGSGRPSPLSTLLASIDYDTLAPSDGLTIRTERVVSAPDGNIINLQLILPERGSASACIYYVHGGGMAAMSCYDPNYRAWGRLIAAQGVAVVMVDFRNALSPSSVPEVAPFPAGLDDCVSGWRWLRANADALGIDPSRIVVAGESGGANLAIAMLLTLAGSGELHAVAGLYVSCPYLAGAWPDEPGSSVEANAGLFLDPRSNFGAMSYGIEAFEARDPRAWPGFATARDLAGFPATVVAVNECDPLRDDGVAFYRTLLEAGVPARCRQLMGTIHGTEIFFACPDISLDAARDIALFARK